MKLGVAGMIPGDNRKVDTEALARVRSAGFSGCSLFLPAADEVSAGEIERLRTVFGRAGLRVAQVNARYQDLVQRDASLRRAGIATLGAAVRAAAALAADTVYVR